MAVPCRSGRIAAINYKEVKALVAERVGKTSGRISAKRVLPAARAAGLCRVGAELPARWSRQREGRVAPRSSPGSPARGVDPRVTRWSSIGASKAGCMCSARCWRGRGSGSCGSPAMKKPPPRCDCWRECFEALVGVPKTVLADRMGCLKAGVVANVVVPTADYMRFATHYGSGRTSAKAADPESKGIVEAPGRLRQARPRWCLRQPSLADLPAATPLPPSGAQRSTPQCIQRDLRGAGRPP